jgi:hypothetical protein
VKARWYVLSYFYVLITALSPHIGKDTLVSWGWAPGFGRTPAPGTQKEASALAEHLVNSSAVCP